ncbi:MAG: hypothetical protein HFE95_07320 [Acutalibacter sp.]|nr:hypothetical protein [Acutalibacter sp.]
MSQYLPVCFHALGVLAEIPYLPLDLTPEQVCLIHKIPGNLSHVCNFPDCNLSMFPVPLAGLNRFSLIAYENADGPKAQAVLCCADFPGLGNAPEAVIAPAPGRVARGGLYKVEAVVVLEVCAGDFHNGPCLRACLKNRKHRLFALSGRICVSKILVIRKHYLRFSSSNRTGQGKNPALSLFSNKP